VNLSWKKKQKRKRKKYSQKERYLLDAAVSE